MNWILRIAGVGAVMVGTGMLISQLLMIGGMIIVALMLYLAAWNITGIMWHYQQRTHTIVITITVLAFIVITTPHVLPWSGYLFQIISLILIAPIITGGWSLILWVNMMKDAAKYHEAHEETTTAAVFA